MARSRTVVVAGAGIGGLTASLALAAKGFRVLIIETAERLEEAGAGLQLSPNASRILIGLGLHARLSTRALVPEAVEHHECAHGGEICRLPLGEAAASRDGRSPTGWCIAPACRRRCWNRFAVIPTSNCASARRLKARLRTPMASP